MHLATVSQPAFASERFSPAPILDAFDRYRGTVLDLDERQAIGPAALRRARDELAVLLTDQGLREGDRVVLAAANGPFFFASLAAVLSLGGSPLLVHVKTPPTELNRTALRYGAVGILTNGWSPAELVDFGREAKSWGERWKTCVWMATDLESKDFNASYPAFPGVPLHPTSGTTGLPKIALRPGLCAMAEAAHYVAALEVQRCDLILACTPMSHAYAYGMGVMVPLLTGCNVAAMRQFDPAVARQALHELGVTILPAAPAMLDVLTFGAGDALRETARCVLSAGAPLPERTSRRFQQCSGMNVRPLYGTTETGGITVAESLEALPAAGYVGRPMAGVEARLSSAAAECGNGAALSRLSIRSSSMMAGYLSRDGVDDRQLPDGWFETGDLAALDGHGGITLFGRESEVINVGGLKVVPCEVEEWIAALSGVQQVKVYPGADRNGRQFVKAAVVAPERTEHDVRAHCERGLVYYKCPRRVLLLETLPRSANGKIAVGELP